MTATATEPTTLEDLDFQIGCQVELWYVVLNMQKDTCKRPAQYTATIHDFRNCGTYDKFVCNDCLPLFQYACPVCKNGPRLTNLRPLR
jgi:hypothetical protein